MAKIVCRVVNEYGGLTALTLHQLGLLWHIGDRPGSTARGIAAGKTVSSLAALNLLRSDRDLFPMPSFAWTAPLIDAPLWLTPEGDSVVLRFPDPVRSDIP